DFGGTEARSIGTDLVLSFPLTRGDSHLSLVGLADFAAGSVGRLQYVIVCVAVYEPALVGISAARSQTGTRGKASDLDVRTTRSSAAQHIVMVDVGLSRPGQV